MDAYQNGQTRAGLYAVLTQAIRQRAVTVHGPTGSADLGGGGVGERAAGSQRTPPFSAPGFGAELRPKCMPLFSAAWDNCLNRESPLDGGSGGRMGAGGFAWLVLTWKSCPVDSKSLIRHRGSCLPWVLVNTAGGSARSLVITRLSLQRARLLRGVLADTWCFPLFLRLAFLVAATSPLGLNRHFPGH